MKKKFLLGLILVLTAISSIAQDKLAPANGKILYENNFEKADLDKIPSEFLVLDGGFAVKQEEGNKFLELPGAPLETFGLLFGPTTETDVTVTAKFRGTAKGRRFPTFAVGLNGVGGYRLQVSPAKKLIELYKSDEVVGTIPFEEKIGSWMSLHLENRKISGNEWNIIGIIRQESLHDSTETRLIFKEKAKPVAGRASIWGSPYSGTPIQFDDLKVASLAEK